MGYVTIAYGSEEWLISHEDLWNAFVAAREKENGNAVIAEELEQELSAGTEEAEEVSSSSS